MLSRTATLVLSWTKIPLFNRVDEKELSLATNILFINKAAARPINHPNEQCFSSKIHEFHLYFQPGRCDGISDCNKSCKYT
jgi:hypothetical protein